MHLKTYFYLFIFLSLWFLMMQCGCMWERVWKLVCKKTKKSHNLCIYFLCLFMYCNEWKKKIIVYYLQQQINFLNGKIHSNNIQHTKCAHYSNETHNNSKTRKLILHAYIHIILHFSELDVPSLALTASVHCLIGCL